MKNVFFHTDASIIKIHSYTQEQNKNNAKVAFYTERI
jgi:hypothetical protein